MAEPSQLQAAGVKRSDIPGNVPHKADPEGIAAACDRKTIAYHPAISCGRGCEPFGIVHRGGKSGGVARAAPTPAAVAGMASPS